MDVKTFRDNLFQMSTRRFGSVMEILVKRLTQSQNSYTIFHDLNTDTGTRVEVKFSRVERKHNRKVTDTNVLELIATEGLSVRIFPFGEWIYYKFDSNIQQIKKPEFDVLVYGLLFADRIVLFWATADQINGNMGYSNKQHKGNVGEGQFHIKQSNLQYHLDNHLFAVLSYQDAYDLLASP